MSDDLVREKLRLYADDVAPARLPSFGGVTVRRRRRRAERALASTTVVLTVVAAVLVGLLTQGSTSRPAVGPVTPASQAQLIGPVWALTSIRSGGSTWRAPAGAPRFSLTFAKGGYSGNDGCNSVGGVVSYGSGTLRLLPGQTTQVLCTGPGIDVMFKAYQGLLSRPVRAELSAGELVLTTDQQVVTLHTYPLASQLAGVKWILSSWSRGGATTRIASGLHDGALFADRAIDLNDGCRDYIAAATYSLNAVSPGAISESTPTCDRGQEARAFRALLGGRFAVLLQGTSLTLSGHSVVLVLDAGQQSTYPPAIGVEPANPSGTVAPVPQESQSPAVTSQLVGTTWQLGSWSFNRESHATVGDKVTLAFSTDGANVQLDAGCNKPTATATYDGATLRLSGTAAAPPCPNQDVGLRAAYQRLEGGPIQVTVTPDRLTLAGTGVVFELVSTKTSTVAPQLPLQKALQGTRWQLLTVDGPGGGGHWSVPADSGTIAFGALTWDASDGCNDHMGSLLYGAGTATGGTLLMAQGASSAVGCFAPLQQRLEQLERTDLTGDVTVSLSGERLTVHSGQDTLVFGQGASGPEAAQVPANDADITQLLTAWTWQAQSWSLNGTNGTADPNAAHPSTLVFGYQTAASSGCGAMNAAVAYRDSSIAFSGGAVPTVLCGPPSTSPQNAFIHLFSGGAEVGVSGTTLTLSGNGLVMTFTAGASRSPS